MRRPLKKARSAERRVASGQQNHVGFNGRYVPDNGDAIGRRHQVERSPFTYRPSRTDDDPFGMPVKQCLQIIAISLAGNELLEDRSGTSAYSGRVPSHSRKWFG